MNESIDPVLRDPNTGERLQLEGEALVNSNSGRRYAIRDGIPIFVETVTGQNKKYQGFYDRLAFLYDPAEKLYRWLRKESFRKYYLDELEVTAGAWVLEVSVGTGANIPHLRSDVEFFGLDLSWGMLRQCRKNLKKWNRHAELFQGEGERLPFVDNIFDVVFHVGGINFFNDRARAIEEMIRVAKPGTKLVIVDETEKQVKEGYEEMPLVGRYFKKRTQTVTSPVSLVPSNMLELRCEEVANGRLYRLTFRKPGGNVLPI
jgi:ubiquinone/menaquinone biosynthesis C-methylase UbiE